jgi:hypothetical protein
VKSQSFRPNSTLRALLAVTWLGLAIVFLVWQSISYRGLLALLAEWEFETFGVYHPAITYLALLAILCSPMLLFRRRAKANKAATVPPPTDVPRQNPEISINSVRILLGLAIVALLAAAGVGLFGFALPNDDGPIHTIAVADQRQNPMLGPADLRGRVQFNQISVLNESVLNFKYNTRFAPMVGEGADRTHVRYFVELPPDAKPNAAEATSVYRGVLRQGGMPGELVRLYRYAGLKIDPGYYVLFANTGSMRRAYMVSAGELLFLALIALLLGGILGYGRSRANRLTRRRANLLAAA